MRSAAVVPVVFATSDMERSTSSPGPPWRTTRVRGQRGDRGVQPADPLHRAAAGLHRLPARVPAHGQRAALGLQDDLGERAVGVRARQAVGSDGDDDQLGIPLVERNRIAGEPLRVGDQDVGTGEQRVELVVKAGSVPERRGCLDDRAVAEVEELEQRAATVGGVRVGPRPVPLVGPATERIAVGPFHLDHVGSGVTEELGAVPPRDPRGAVDHLQIRQQIHPPKPTWHARSRSRETSVAWAGC